MQINYLAIVVMGVCAITFYRAGQQEHSWGMLWAASSIAASFLALRFLPWGMFGVMLAQSVPFTLITLYRMRQK